MRLILPFSFVLLVIGLPALGRPSHWYYRSAPLRSCARWQCPHQAAPRVSARPIATPAPVPVVVDPTLQANNKTLFESKGTRPLLAQWKTAMSWMRVRGLTLSCDPDKAEKTFFLNAKSQLLLDTKSETASIPYESGVENGLVLDSPYGAVVREIPVSPGVVRFLIKYYDKDRRDWIYCHAQQRFWDTHKDPSLRANKGDAPPELAAVTTFSIEDEALLEIGEGGVDARIARLKLSPEVARRITDGDREESKRWLDYQKAVMAGRLAAGQLLTRMLHSESASLDDERASAAQAIARLKADHWHAQYLVENAVALSGRLAAEPANSLEREAFRAIRDFYDSSKPISEYGAFHDLYERVRKAGTGDLHIDLYRARKYSELRELHRRRGRPIPEVSPKPLVDKAPRA